MKLLLFVTILVFQSWAWAAPQCAKDEIDVLTKKNFTLESWDQALDEWLSEEPEHPGYYQLFIAYNLYSSEKPQLKKFKRDKQKHCYIGCRMGEELPEATAVYVAWYKEYRDLTDCDKNSFFELKDFEVTLKGITAGQDSERLVSCFELCSQ